MLNMQAGSLTFVEGQGIVLMAADDDKKAGFAQVPVQTESELVDLMQQGIAKRTVARTGMNAASSRSHCLVMLTVEKHWADGTISHGKLCLVDLAGAHPSFPCHKCASLH